MLFKPGRGYGENSSLVAIPKLDSALVSLVYIYSHYYLVLLLYRLVLPRSILIMSVSETTKLLEETRVIVYDQPEEQTRDSPVSLSTIHTLLTQMNFKLSNIEMKNNSLDSRLSVIESRMSSIDESAKHT